MLRVILEENLVSTLSSGQKSALNTAAAEWPLNLVTARTGMKEEMIRSLARSFARAKTPLALAKGLTCSGANATETAAAANLLCTVVPETQKAVDFESLASLGEVAKAQDMKALSERMERGEVELLMIYNANPVFSLPAAWNIERGMKSVPFIVSFSNTMDETSQYAHVFLPVHTPLESWGDPSPSRGVRGIMQPVMGPVFNTRHLGDILLSNGKKLNDPRMFPWEDFYQMIQYLWAQRGRRQAPNMPFEAYWVESLKKGGAWEANDPATSKFPMKLSRPSFPGPDSVDNPKEGFHFITYPAAHFFDGRRANRPWLQELP